MGRKKHIKPVIGTEGIVLRKVLEYSDIFGDRNSFDIRSTLAKYNRRLLVDAAAILVNNYANALIPGGIQFFSYPVSAMCVHLMKLIETFKKAHPEYGKTVFYCTEKTSVELLRYIFEIPVADYTDTKDVEELEFDLFMVLLAINEDNMSIARGEGLSLSSCIYVNQFANNDLETEHEFCFRAQLLYAWNLFSFMELAPEMKPVLEDFYNCYGIEHWSEYVLTISGIYAIKAGSMDQQKTGRKVLVMSESMKEGLRQSVVDQISVDMNDCFGEENEDYKIFRSKPLIRIDEKTYYIGNNQMLCERMYNSLFFEFKQSWEKYHEKTDFFSFYNRNFVEAYLFDSIVVNCVDASRDVTAPGIDPRHYANNLSEEDSQPDFYIRHNDEISIFECKGTKLNGRLKTKADVADVLESLKERIYVKKNGTDEGVGQLLNHITSIEDDVFKWDKCIPDQVAYYPVLVLENDGLNKRGLMGLANEWMLEGRRERDLMSAGCRPLIVMNISTLFYYSDTFRKKGFRYLFEDFYRHSVTWGNDGTYEVKASASFDQYMRRYDVSRSGKAFIRDLLEQMRKLVR
ncbi:MAG: hypothetical protein Q4G10_03645 [Bacteroidia bacterium]|nr:hypothetical protein [Bacteroidia bacterium]